MATWNAAFEATPAGSDAPDTIDDKINEFKEEVRTRMGNEHGTYDNTAQGADGSQAADWCHRTGSGLAYYQSDAPTARPGGTALDSSGSNDDGRLWVSNGSNKPIKVWSGGTWFSTAVGAVVDQNSTGNALKFKVTSIGDWNMDTTAEKSVVVLPAASYEYFRICDIVIRQDSNGGSASNTYPLNYTGAYGTTGARYHFQSGAVIMKRLQAGVFDSADYDQTSWNRGWITVAYI